MLFISDRGELAKGTILTLGNKKYRIIKLLGLGTSCIVYKAQITIYIDDKTLERTVVLKELYPKGLGIKRKLDNSLEIPENARKIFDEYINRFKKACERQIAFHNDEKIANSTTEIHQIYITNNTLYSIMGIVTGNSYDNVHPNDIESILNVGMSLADCIAIYHEKGYLHLDIKPANIFNADLPGDNVAIQLFDFDSVSTKEEILSGNLSYSVEYAAPEVKAVKSSNGKLSAIDEKADLFSIGSVIFEKIMGRCSKAEDHSSGKNWDFSDNPYLKNAIPQLQKGITDFFRKTLARNANKRYASAKELARALEKLIKLAKIDVFLKNQNIYPCTAKNIYIPRKNTCDTICEQLNQYHILYLYAIRGSGKSETAKEYAEINANKYDFIQLVFYSQNLKKTIANLDFVGLKYEDKIAHTDEDIDRLYSYKLDLLGNTDIYTSNTLLIIDNYDYDCNPESEEYKTNAKVLYDLKKLHIHIIFTTRINPTDKAHCFKLEDMSKTELEQLFFKINPVQKDNPERIKLVDEIIKVSYNHTMTVKLIALQSKKYKKSLEEYLSVLKENGLNSHIQGRITNEKDDESVTMSAVYEHIKALFDFDDLSSKEKYIMVNACLLPLEGLDTVTFSNFIDLNNFDVSSSECIDESIENLVNRGWMIYTDSDETQISLHPLICDIATNELKPELTGDKCRNFYISFLDLISEWGNNKANDIDLKNQEKLVYLLLPQFNNIFYNKKIIEATNYLLFHNEKVIIQNHTITFDKKIIMYFGIEKKYIVQKYIDTICTQAFKDCTYVEEILIPNNVIEVQIEAFANCSSLKNINLPDNMTVIEMGMFSNCVALTQINIPKLVTEIKACAFDNCRSLTQINMPKNLNEIGECAFKNCISIKQIRFPDGIKKIGMCAFDGCTSLIQIDIPNGVTTIEALTFDNCTSLKAVNISKSVVKIRGLAFNNCISLTQVTIPNSVTEIESYAFSDCKTLTQLTIPDSITKIDRGAFSGCLSLTQLNISKKLYIKFREVFQNKIQKKINIANSINKIRNYAFAYNIRLTNISIPDGVTIIGKSAFEYCASLKSINIPNSINNIEKRAFWGCTNLKNITLPGNLSTIGDKAFQHCTALTQVAIPNSVNKIGEFAFGCCTSLEQVILSQNITEIIDGTFALCTSLKRIVIPNGIKKLGIISFLDCTSLTQITLPNSIIEIDEQSFGNCLSLTQITIPKGTQYVYEDAFDYPTLSKITFLNPQIKISESLIGFYKDKKGLYRKNDNLTIEGYKGSTAEEYAKEHGFNFESIN